MGKLILPILLFQVLTLFQNPETATAFFHTELKTKLKNVDGTSLSVSGIAGQKGTVVFFSSNACEVTKKADGFLRVLATDFARKGIGFVAVNSNSPAISALENLEAMKKKSYPFPYLADEDGRLAKFFGATHNAEYFLLDAGRKIIFHGSSEIEPLKEAVQSLLAGLQIQQTAFQKTGRPITRTAVK